MTTGSHVWSRQFGLRRRADATPFFLRQELEGVDVVRANGRGRPCPALEVVGDGIGRRQTAVADGTEEVASPAAPTSYRTIG